MLAINRPADKRASTSKKQAGFSLPEVIIAMLIMIILLMGTLRVFTYAVQYTVVIIYVRKP